MSWRATILTLYPDMFPGPLEYGICKRAYNKKLWEFDVVDIRQYGIGPHRQVDDSPAGGGPGMVLRADVLAKCFDAHHKKNQRAIYLSARGRPLKQKDIQLLSEQESLTLICGRFEGIDERFLHNRPMIEEVSIGDYVLAGGEIAAMVIIEAIIRLLPHSIGNHMSLKEESFWNNQLEYPHYTKPRIWEDTPIPSILLSGNHKSIKQWRQKQAQDITQKRRPDLFCPKSNKP